MKRLLCIVLSLLVGTMLCKAQFGSFGDVPIEITSEGETQFIGGIARAENNVVIHYGEATIYCDYAEYNPETRDVLVRGNVRIYRPEGLFTGERAVYNLETKQLRGADFAGDQYPFRFSGDTISSIGTGDFLVKDALFTTSDSSKPDYQLRARTVRIYPDDRVIFSNVTLFIGRTPVFWFPYLYQSLKEDTSFTITPGYTSVWGGFLLTQYTFPIAEKMTGQFRLDLRSKRGVGVGFESKFAYGKNDRSWGNFRSYYTDDASPGTTRTGKDREEVDSARYRVQLEHRMFITDDLYASIDVHKISDPRFLEDFFEGEFRGNPQPDNVVSVTQWNENYTLTLIARSQVNSFFETTERLPEVVLDIKRQPLFGSGFFYEGETGGAFLRRNFEDDSTLPDYDTFRFDSFHQILYPGTYFGFLSFVPRIGARGTYYGDSGAFELNTVTMTVDSLVPGEEPRKITTTERLLTSDGSVFRPVFNTGFEASFKFSKPFEQVQSRLWGLDGLRHVVQPYTNVSFVMAGEDPDGLYQFDRFNPSTQLPPLDFPQFTAIDSIPDWSVVRLGVRNRLQTRRDNQTFNWLELDTFVDVNIDEPRFPGIAYEEGTFSNVFNNLRWNPVPWVRFSLDTQFPLLDSGFTEVNTTLNFLVNRDWQLILGDRYINGNPFFEDSNVIDVGTFYQFNENWAISLRERFEVEDSRLESQRYEIHRSLSSWIASLGMIIRDNGDKNDYGVLLTFSLKDLPEVTLPIAFDPGAIGPGGNSE
jgi:LPS-assembly protein